MVSPETTSTSIDPHPSQTPSLSSTCVMKDLGPNDVLLGRGTGPNEQIGNIRFRALVRDVIQASGKRGLDGKEKTRLAKSVIQEVKAKGGRFVRKVEGGGGGGIAPSSCSSSDLNKHAGIKVGDHYEEVSDALALDKTKQSFRHQLRGTKISSPGTTNGSAGGSGARDLLLNLPPANLHTTKEYSKQGSELSKKAVVQDASVQKHKQPIPRSIVLQRSSSASSSGGGGTSAPPSFGGERNCSTTTTTARTSTLLTDGLLKLKCLQHEERSDMFSAGLPSSGSFVDHYLLTAGLRNSLLSYASTTNELMRKELASRYLLAEAILLGGGVGVREPALVTHHFGRPEGGVLSSSSLPFPSAAARMHHGSHHHVLSAPGTSQQSRASHMDTTLPIIFENVSSSRANQVRSSPGNFQHADRASPSSKKRSN